MVRIPGRNMFWIAVSCIAAAVSARGDEPSVPVSTPNIANEASESPPIRFQRIHVPADRIRDWPLGRQRHLPMSREEFERLAGAGDAAPNNAVPRVLKAQYRGSLTDQGVLEGTAALQVDPVNQTSGFLSLPMGQIATRNLRWREAGRTTTHGVTDRGTSEVLVEVSGWLEFDWTLKAGSGAAGDQTFTLDLPESADMSLALDLPAAVTPECEPGVLVSTSSHSNDRKTWRFALGGRPRAVVRLRRADTEVAGDSRPEVHESVVYHFSRSGLEVEASLRIEAVSRPLRRVSFVLAPELTFVAARLGQISLPWSGTARDADASTRVVVELPESLPPSGGVLHLSAWSPLVRERPWLLPAIRPENMFWRAGNATLLVPGDFRLVRLREIDARQSRFGRLPGADQGESAEFQYFSPIATVEVVLSESHSPVRIDQGSHIDLNESETTCKVVAVFKTTHVKLFELEARIDRPWVVDSVRSRPAGRVKDWRLERCDDNADRLVMRLAKPLSPADDSLQVEIVTRRLESPLGRVIGMNDLTPVRFPGAVVGRRIVALRAGSPRVLATIGDESPRRIVPDGSDAETRALLPDAWDGLLFEHDANADSLRFELAGQRPGYAGEVEVEATVSGESLLEAYRFRCIPKSSRMEHVVVRFSRARGAAPRWSLGEEEGHPLSARRLSDSEQIAAGMTPGPETWKVSLVPSRGEPFDIRAARTIPFREETAVSLASLAEADSQSAVLVVRAVEGVPLRIANRRLEPIPTSPPPLGEYQTARGTYRYDPSHVVESSQEDSFTIAPDGRTDCQTSLLPWCKRIDSRFEEHGGARHVATYHIENLGAPTIEIVFAESRQECQIREVWIDGRAASWRPEAMESGDKRVSIDLPAGKRFLVVQIDFSTPRPGLAFLDWVAPPELTLNAPVPVSRWVVWLPTSHCLPSAGAGSGASAIDRANWRERLLGPLARPSHERPFDPRVADDWRSLANWTSNELSTAANRLLDTIDRLPNIASNEAKSTLALGELLASPQVRAAGVSILVDEPALAGAGLFPSTPVEVGNGSTRVSRGSVWFRKAGLAFVMLDDVALLTSSLRVSLLQNQLKSTGSSLAWRSIPGPLEASLRSAADGRADEPWIGVDAWQAIPPSDTSPWYRFDQLASISRDTKGWNAYSLELGLAEPVRLRVAHRDALGIVRWTLFLAAVGLGMWKGIHRPRWLFGVAASCAVLVFLVPEVPAVAASGTLLGTLFCLSVWLFRTWSRAEGAFDPKRSSDTSAHSARSRVTLDLLRTLLISIVAASCVGWSCAASVAGELDQAGTPLGVLIPVDEHRRPKGEKVYVPESLYRQLARRRAVGSLIETAAYRSELKWEGTPRRLVPGEMRAVFRLNVLDSSRAVRIPFSRRQVILGDDWAFLDGAAVRPEWNAEDDAFHLSVPSEGHYRLELLFATASLVSNTSSDAAFRDDGGFDLRVPAVPDSRLELTLPANPPAVDVPSAQGNVTLAERKLSAFLGATDSLRVRWRGGDRDPDGGVPAEVDELLLMSVTPGSVMVEARFRVRVLHGRVGDFLLRIDPRLEPVGRPSVGVLEAVAGSPGLLRAILPSPQSEDFDYRIRFSLRGATGVGHHRLPTVGVEGPRVAGRWFGVAIDDSLEWTEKSAADHAALESVAVPDFLAMWGGNVETAPRMAYRRPGGSTRWSIATRPRPPRTIVDQRITASVGPKQATIRYEAHLGRAPGHGFRYRLLIPASVSVDSLSVRESESDIGARWTQSDDGTVEVFLSGPAVARRHLVFEGRIDAPREGVFELPIPSVADAYQQSCHVTLFRQPSVHIDLDRYEGLGEAEPEVIRADSADLGHLVVSMINSGNKAPRLWLRATPNHPETTVLQTTHIERLEEKWVARTRFEIESRGGSADEVRVLVSPEHREPFLVSPPTPFATTSLRDGRTEVVLRFGPSMLDRREFTLTVPLSDDPISVPDIAVRDARTSERRVVLPRQFGERALRWDVRRLQRLSSTSKATTYRVAGDEFRAVLLPSAGAGPGAQVRLADVQLVWHDDGAVHGVAFFDVEPAGRRWLPLVIPEGYQLAWTRVDGVSTTPIPDPQDSGEDEQGRYRVAIGPPALPCRVSVVFRGRLGAPLASSSFTFAAPRLGDLPVEKTIWLVAAPAARQHQARQLALESQRDVIRAEALISLIQSAARSKAVASDKNRWSEAWRDRFLRIESSIVQHLASPSTPEAKSTLERTLDSLRRQWNSPRKTDDSATSPQNDTLGPKDNSRPARSAPVAPRDDNPAGLLRQDAFRSPESAVYRTVMNGYEPLTVQFVPRSPSRVERDLPVLLLLILLAALSYLAVRRGVVRAVMRYWPEAVPVTVGLIWWLWMVPSVVGPIVMLAGFWLTARRFRPRRTKPSSVIIPFD